MLRAAISIDPLVRRGRHSGFGQNMEFVVGARSTSGGVLREGDNWRLLGLLDPIFIHFGAVQRNGGNVVVCDYFKLTAGVERCGMAGGVCGQRGAKEGQSGQNLLCLIGCPYRLSGLQSYLSATNEINNLRQYLAWLRG